MTTLNELLGTTLPLNRKERYYTGTVLPALLCADSMKHLSRLGRPELLDIGDLDVRASPDDCTVLFFTEYSIIESAVGESAMLFPGMAALAKDTPDVVILITEPRPVLIALEAKMYDRPSQGELNLQLEKQRVQLDHLSKHLARHLNVDEVHVAHAALLPTPLADKMPNLIVRTITWEQILEVYSDIDQEYFRAILTTALSCYGDLVSKSGGYQDGDLAGAKLVTRFLAGDPTWPYMGANGGLGGKRIKERVADGSWATTLYQCRHQALPGNKNWFTVAEFVQTLRTQGVNVDALAPSVADAHIESDSIAE